jgi:aspartate racemase
MKKLGIVGGVAWASTVDYYKTICRLSMERHAALGAEGPPSFPEMSIESLNIKKSFGLRGGDITDDASWAAYDAYFRAALQRLASSGAEVAIIASNTPHNRLASITRGLDIPVVSIFDAVAKACAGLGVKDMLILGTAPTMDAPNFAAVLATHGIKAFSPPQAEARKKTVALIAELQTDRNERAAQRMQDIVDASFAATTKPRAVCLACTELPLAFPALERQGDLVVGDIHYINTTVVHAKAAFAALLAT